MQKEEIVLMFQNILKQTKSNSKIIKSKSELESKTGGFWGKNEWDGLLKVRGFRMTVALESGIAFGFSIFEDKKDYLCVLLSGNNWDSWNETLIKIDMINYSVDESIRIKDQKIKGKQSPCISVGNTTKQIHEIKSDEEKVFLEKIVLGLNQLHQREVELEQERNRQLAQEEEKRVADLVLKKDSILTEFDKDGNGTIDVIEGADDFLTLFKKHQKAIIEVDKDYIQNFVKISNYLKIKRRNIQSIFENFNEADTHEDLENRVGILKNDIHTYEVLLMHSLNMITTLVNEDMITFYEIYESFDKLNVFNSNWENEISGKLSDIGDGLNQLIYSVNKMNQDIIQELSYLSYTTEASFQELQSSVSAELSSINSSIQFGNLLSGIQTYQLHKINKRGDNLLK